MAPPSTPTQAVGDVVVGCPDDREPEIDVLICPVICACNHRPTLSKSGAELKQQCVSKILGQYDDLQGNKSTIKAEVNYDMTKKPPTPIMSRTNPLRPSGYLPARLDEIPNFVPKEGMVRRPDVVIVKDPSQPPIQDNLRCVVEIKFPPDTMSDDRRRAYERIAGDDADLKILGPDECKCPKPTPETEPVRVPAPSPLEIVLLSVALVALVLDDLIPVGATQADDALIPAILARLAMAF